MTRQVCLISSPVFFVVVHYYYYYCGISSSRIRTLVAWGGKFYLSIAEDAYRN